MQSSSLILRSNPKLTGNLRILVDTDSNIYLDSIDANKELSNSKFKKIKINNQKSLSENIANFFKNTPNNIIFETLRKYSDVIISSDINQTYENQYNYGSYRNKHGLNGKFSIFAPLYIGDSLPKKFVVFKLKNAKSFQYIINPNILPNIRYKIIEGQIDYNGVILTKGDTFEGIVNISPIYDSLSKWVINDFNTENIDEDIVSDSEIVKIFDISEKSEIGKLIYGHKNDTNYNSNPIFVDFKNNIVKYNGISLSTGVLTTINDIISTESESEIISTDEFITQGFERNGLLNPNIFNIEFLFNDTIIDDNINRYYGLYVDDIDVGSFYMDNDIFSKSGKYYNPFNGVNTIPYGYKYNIEDPDGIKLIPDLTTVDNHIFDDSKIISTPNTYFYIKDINDNIHKINNKSTRFNSTSINFNEIFGFGNTHDEYKAEASDYAGNSISTIEITKELYTSYKIELFYRNTPICFVYGDHLPTLGIPYGVGDNHCFYFYPYGDLEHIAIAIANAFNYTFLNNDLSLVAEAIGSKVHIIVKYKGVGGDNHKLYFTDDSYIKYHKFSGGTTLRSKVKCDINNFIEVDDYTYIATDNGYTKIKSITPYLDEPIYVNKKIVGFSNYNKYVNITVYDDQPIKIDNGCISIFNLKKLKSGCFSICNVSDFDFDFFSTDYNGYYFNEIKKYYGVQNDSLVELESYILLKNDSDTISPIIKYFDGTNDITVFENDVLLCTTDGDRKYTIIAGDPILINVRYFNDEELKKFIGFNTLSNNNFVANTDESINNKFKIFKSLNGVIEYDKLYENARSKNAVKSKIVPIINKWVKDESNNIRDIEYRLNISPTFGDMNFTPSFIDKSQNPQKFTHEWLYLSSIPENIKFDDLVNSKSYFAQKFDKIKYKDKINDYFSNYFIVDNFIVDNSGTISIADIQTQNRFSIIKKKSDGVYSTFLRGVDIDINSKNDISNYKFSCILNVNKTKILENSKPFEIEIIKNDDHKNIVFLVSIIIDDYKILPDIVKNEHVDYLYLYIMSSLKRYDVTAGSYPYNYGIDIKFPHIIGSTLHYGVTIPSTPPITEFRGLQLYNKIIKYPTLNKIKFDSDNVLLTDQLTPNKDGNYGYLIGMDKNNSLFITSKNVVYSSSQLLLDGGNTIKNIDLNNNSDIELESNGFGILNLLSLFATGNYDAVYVNNLIYPLENTIWFVKDGGYKSYDKIAELLSFSSLNDIITDSDKRYIKYSNINNGLLSESTDFKLSFNKPDQIKITNRINTIVNNVIENSQIINESIIDYDNEFVEKETILNRYSGYYRPKLLNIFEFKNDPINMTWGLYKNSWLNETKLWSSYEQDILTTIWYDLTESWNSFLLMSWTSVSNDIDFISGGIVPKSKLLFGLNTKIYKTNKINNFHYHKISHDINIIKANNPLYPSIGEICIDKDDVNIYKSNWDFIFYNYNDKFNKERIKGYNNLLEDKFFFGSKILNINNEFLLDRFDINEITIDINDIVPQNEIVLYQFINDTAKFRFNFEDLLIQKIFDSVYNNIISYTEHDESIIKLYLKNNIVPYFKIKNVDVFMKLHNDNNHPIIYNSNSYIDLIGKGYIKDKNVKINQISDFDMIITNIEKTESNYSYSFKFIFEN